MLSIAPSHGMQTENTVCALGDGSLEYERSVTVSYRSSHNYFLENLTALSSNLMSSINILTRFDNEDYVVHKIDIDQDFHKIITIKREVFAAEKVEIINQKVGYQDYRSGRYFLLNLNEVALIIYKNGMHKILSDSLTAEACLDEVEDLTTYSSREPSTNIQLSEEEQDYFARRALTKTRAFGSYLSTITDERVDELYQDDAVRLALDLFYDDERMVEVSSLNGNKKASFKISEYLEHLRMLTYAKVELVWNQVAYVNQLRAGEDGEYRGIISVEQIFKGYNSDNIVVYQDITQKNIEIIVKPMKQIIDGEEISKWDVYLSDIGVKSTTEL